METYLLVFYERRPTGLLWKKIVRTSIEDLLRKKTWWSSMEDEDLIVFSGRKKYDSLLKKKTWWSSMKKDLMVFYGRRTYGLLRKKALWSSMEEDLMIFYGRSRPYCQLWKKTYKSSMEDLLQKMTCWPSIEEKVQMIFFHGRRPYDLL